MPPVALSEFVYAVPAVAIDREPVVMTSGGGGGAVMVTKAAADLVESATLVAVIVAVESAVTVDASGVDKLGVELMVEEVVADPDAEGAGA